jgi:hypothetical protein
MQKEKEWLKSSQFYTSLSKLSFYSMCLIKTDLSKNIKKLQFYKNQFCGKRIFLMGNGPSLRQMQLEKLKNEYVFGFNKCYLLYDSVSWRPQFYTSVDSLVVPDIADEINRHLPDENPLFARLWSVLTKI